MLENPRGGYHQALIDSSPQQILSAWVEEVGDALKSWADRAVTLSRNAKTLPDSWWTVLGTELREPYQQFFNEFAELERQEQKEGFKDEISSLRDYASSLTSQEQYKHSRTRKLFDAFDQRYKHISGSLEETRRTLKVVWREDQTTPLLLTAVWRFSSRSLRMRNRFSQQTLMTPYVPGGGSG
jgi:hypothetical protein